MNNRRRRDIKISSSVLSNSIKKSTTSFPSASPSSMDVKIIEKKQQELQKKKKKKKHTNTAPTIESNTENKQQKVHKITLDNEEYIGESKDGKMHGRGEYRFKDKSVYIGEFDNNEITGIGSKTYANGKMYKGQWKIGMYHGRGMLKFSKNDHYNGSFRNSLFHGQGKRTWESGDVYEGRFRDGRRDGRGVLMKAKNEFMYDGDWRDGVMHGDGEIIWNKHPEYSRYVGEFHENIRQGRGMLETKDGIIYKGHFINGTMIKGRMILPDGSMYEGDVKGNFPHGTGTIHWSDGTSFQGEWSHGVPYGMGEQSDATQSTLRGCFGEAGVSGPGERVFLISGGKISSNSNNRSGSNTALYRYEGDMRDNKMHGNGKLFWPDGRMYEGQFKADSIEGNGTMLWPANINDLPDSLVRNNAGDKTKSMNKYMGSFSCGMFSGKGTLEFANGVIYEGEFKSGRYHGLGKINMSSIDQGQYSGQWEDGRIVGKGTRIWNNGDVYIGDFGPGSTMHGKGSFVWKNGSQYVGEFVRGERSGNGKQIWESGQYYIGEWKHGHPDGKGILINPNVTAEEKESGSKSQTIGIWGKNGLIKELIVSKNGGSKIGANTVGDDTVDDDIPIFTSIKSTLQTRKMFPQH